MQRLGNLAAKFELTTAEPAEPLRRLGLLVVTGMAASLALQPVLNIVWKLLFDVSVAEDLARRFGEQVLRANPAVILLVAAIGPVIEEFIFRWGGFKLLRWLRVPTPAIVLVTSVAFGAAHLGIAPVTMAFATLVGLLLGWIYARTNDIWCAIATHAGLNAGALMLMAMGAAARSP